MYISSEKGMLVPEQAEFANARRDAGSAAVRDRRALIGYLALTAFCMVFSAVYEYFSHGVYSMYMVGLAVIPLMLGALPIMAMRLRGQTRPEGMTRTLQLWTVLTLTVGSCVTGVFEIYGGASAFTKYYWAAGLVLAVATGISFLRERS